MSYELDAVEALLEESMQKKQKEKKQLEREKEREKDRERRGDRKRKRRSRSRSRDRKHRRSKSRDKDRDRHSSSRRKSSRSSRSSRSSSRRSGDDDRSYRSSSTRSQSHKHPSLDKPKQDAVSDADRDSRTVFAYNLPLRASERDLFDFFGKAGKVRDVRLISDRNSRKSKGFGYIEFCERAAIEKALQLSGTQFMKQTVMVQASQAEKNRVVTANQASAAMGPTRLYVGSLHYNITEEDIRAVFEPFGSLEFVNLHRDADTGRSKGFAFVQFKNASDAKRALQDVNGLELAGRLLKVGLVTECAKGEAFELDDSGIDGGGMALNAHSRAVLMSKLQRDEQIEGAPGEHQIDLMQPTPCLLLKNMFDPAMEEGDFEAEIKEDVKDECEKYGTIMHIHVDKNSQGHVYIKFEKIASAQHASKDLNGRWFAGKMITVDFINIDNYEEKFNL